MSLFFDSPTTIVTGAENGRYPPTPNGDIRFFRTISSWGGMIVGRILKETTNHNYKP